MTIDERLDRLTERHEALTQTLELLTHDILEMVAQNVKRDEHVDRLDEIIGNIMEAVSKLLRIAEIHEQRISRLEGNNPA